MATFLAEYLGSIGTHLVPSRLGAVIFSALLLVVPATVGCSVSSPFGGGDEAGGDPSASDDTGPTVLDDGTVGESPDGGTVGEDSGDEQPDGADIAESAAELGATARSALDGADGTLAVAADGRLAIMAPDGTAVTWLLDDDAQVATQPTWSPDGTRLVWLEAAADGNAVVVAGVGADGDREEIDLPGQPAFYFQWGPDGERIAYLRNALAAGGVELGTITLDGGPVGVGVSAPFFVHWSPAGGGVLAAHIGNAQVVVVDDDTAGRGGLRPDDVLLERTGTFSTPVWLDERTLLVADRTGLVLLDVEAAATEPLLIVDRTGSADVTIQFVVSPDRSRLAYQILGEGIGASQPVGNRPDDLTAQPGLVVVDLATGASEVVSSDLALAWEWSADGRRLAWLTPAPSTDRFLVRWSFWDLDAGAIGSTPGHEPSPVVASAYLPFFEQYAHSVTGWAPDGAAFAFAGRVPADGPGADSSIWVHLPDAGGEVATVRVAAGDVVTWGPTRP